MFKIGTIFSYWNFPSTWYLCLAIPDDIDDKYYAIELASETMCQSFFFLDPKDLNSKYFAVHGVVPQEGLLTYSNERIRNFKSLNKKEACSFEKRYHRGILKFHYCGGHYQELFPLLKCELFADHLDWDDSKLDKITKNLLDCPEEFSSDPQLKRYINFIYEILPYYYILRAPPLESSC